MQNLIILLFVIAISFIGVRFYLSQLDSAVAPTQAPTSLQQPPSDETTAATPTPTPLIPLDEILSGGPGKDGIPSIDDPQFTPFAESQYAENPEEEIGLGLVVNGDARFYPYSILVWHEIVNDTVGGESVAVTYCPLCRTGVVFNRELTGGVVEFGVSGMLWQSNLLMYDRTGDETTESLWSQVLGTAVVGPQTGTKLEIVTSDTTRLSDWVRRHPDTSVLTQETGAFRAYGTDPYDGYYTSDEVSFGATFSDERLHPKAFVLGVELNGHFKAYEVESIQTGVTTDQFAGVTLRIEKDDVTGGVRMFNDATGDTIPYIGGFWFSWLAVHPDTDLFVTQTN